METLEGCVLEDWAMARTSSGVPYFVNHSRGVTQWDHPEFVRILEEVQSVNSVKYAAYRTACKLRRLQTRLKFHEVSLQSVASAFDGAGLRAAENSDLVELKQVEQVIHKCLRTTYKNRHMHLSLATQLMVNLLLNVYDLGRSGMVQVLGCKVLLVVLCGGRLQEKYRYLFTQIADHNNCCTRRRLAAVLRDLARIPELLSEQPSFGLSLVAAAVESEVGVTEEVLLAWLLKEPQTLVWWTTLYRLTAAELVCHDVKCGVCKQRPVIGLRYQCLRCLGYNLCQDCFLHARTSRNHKLSHPIQEYCHETNGKEWRRALMKILKHRLSGRQGCNKQRYLTIASNPEAGCNMTSLLCEGGARGSWSESSEEDEELLSRTILHTSQDSNSSFSEEGSVRDNGQRNCGSGNTAEPTILPTSPRHQIHSVIMHLEEGHRQLEEGGSQGVDVVDVEEHSQKLYIQINRLKAILQSYNSGSDAGRSGRKAGTGAQVEGRGLPRLESTPIVGERGLLLNLSPIATQLSADDTAVMDNKENHMVENPKETPLKSNPSIRSMRIPFMSYEKNLSPTLPDGQPQMAQDIGGPKVVPQPSRLPSFTEVNFSDLTSLTSAPTSSQTSPRVLPQEMNGASSCQDDAAVDVREELENILRQLDQIFPLAESDNHKVVTPDNGGVVEAACELGDVLAEYVGVVPNQQ
ncbi:Dystrophin-like 1 [Homarus americanus]|uniref:Dystrophin-like 1 n=1 Tax=Homarus americanus TaxID=6706 RepID=A0A8J5NB33_HOMAM|nr:Dystrophin-like 1 [Homarus americanus]